jgi:hypothetical protein
MLITTKEVTMQILSLDKAMHEQDIGRGEMSRQVQSICHPPPETTSKYVTEIGTGTYKVDIQCGDFAVVRNYEAIIAVGSKGEVFFNSSGLKSDIILGYIKGSIPDGWTINDRTWEITCPSGVAYPFIDGITISRSGMLIKTSFDITQKTINKERELMSMWPKRVRYYVEHVIDAWPSLDLGELREIHQRSSPKRNRTIQDSIESLTVDYDIVSSACSSHSRSLNAVVENPKTAQRELKSIMSNYLNASLGLPCEIK